MIFTTKAIPLLLVTICHTSSAWTTLQTSQVIKGVASPSIASKNPLLLGLPTVRTPLTRLSETAGEGDIPKRKRKRKKKVVVEEDDDDEPEVAAEAAAAVVETVAPVVEEPAPVLELKPRDDTPVQFQVTNILASDEPPEPSNLSKVSNMLSSFTSGKEEPKPRSESSGPKFESRPMDDSMSQLLEDVKAMTEEEQAAAEESGGFFSDSEGTGVKQMIGDALSTIVTVDFFVVLGFLLWFLLGIFSRSVFNDDTIQIAFNNNFEKLVQPALGVLMIAALGGNFFKEKEEEYDL